MTRHRVPGTHKFLFAVLGLIACQTLSGNPLEHYIANHDNHYHWRTTAQNVDSAASVSHYQLTSQHWRGLNWQHHLIIVKPQFVRNRDLAFLQIAGDGDGNQYIDNLKLIAGRSGAIAAVLMNVPNQPFFENRREDALIAYTLNQYVKTGDESWPLLFPMVKSATKAMDAIQEIAKVQHRQSIARFIVSGASKRGWTTWLAAAIDTRISAIAPMVIDTLNMKAQLQWAEQIYGQQSVKLKDYTELNLHRRLDNTAMQRLRSWIDPYAYVERYQMPKLILLGTNDPYWTVDSQRFYWDELPEPKLLFQTPNAGHDLNGGGEALQSLAVFVERVADHKPLPELNWIFRANRNSGLIDAQISVNQPVETIRLWHAASTNRDFRKSRWTDELLPVNLAKNSAETTIPKPQTGYQAFLMEAELATKTGQNFKLSTIAKVTPDTEPCHCWTVNEKH